MVCLRHGRIILLILATVCGLFGRSAVAHDVVPEASTWTWAELFSKVDAVCLLKPISFAPRRPPSEQATFPEAEFEVIDVLKGSPNSIKNGDRLKFPYGGDARSFIFVTGVKDLAGSGIAWGFRWETTPRQIEYLKGASSIW